MSGKERGYVRATVSLWRSGRCGSDRRSSSGRGGRPSYDGSDDGTCTMVGGPTTSLAGYDSLSYDCNFDEGQRGDIEDDTVRRGFSVRFATSPTSAKSSMDLGG
ncbi:hypothetical protein Cni_G18243 [Canna indica]|uniref:Uncharacterized protein n=1 Tax=Canna indica TaxID=4628 RepID=A0AAQ3KJ33_9LILI|nr:hypothetical protein Cni_G18243 [Canna indica]